MKYDIEGKEIHVGDKVIFVYSTYSTNSLQIGTVLKYAFGEPIFTWSSRGGFKYE